MIVRTLKVAVKKKVFEASLRNALILVINGISHRVIRYTVNLEGFALVVNDGAIEIFHNVKAQFIILTSMHFY